MLNMMLYFRLLLQRYNVFNSTKCCVECHFIDTECCSSAIKRYLENDVTEHKIKCSVSLKSHMKNSVGQILHINIDKFEFYD